MAGDIANKKQIISIIKSVSGQANLITIPRIFIDVVSGDLSTAVLLSQIVYWSDKSKRDDGWFYKTYGEWEAETSLSQFQVKRSGDQLKRLGLLQTKIKKANGFPTVHYKLDFGLLTNLIIEKLDNRETQQTVYEVSSYSDYEETSQSLTETTQQTTTKNTVNFQAEMLGVLSDVTKIDYKIKRNAGRLAKPSKELLDAGYLPEQVKTFYSPGEWWYTHDWRGQKGQPPTPEQVLETIAQAKDGIRKNGRRAEPAGFAAIREYMEEQANGNV